MKRLILFCLGSCVFVTAHASGLHRETVSFSHTWDVGFGRSVYVVGNHRDVGAWNPVNAVRLEWTPGNVWTGQVAIQAGTDLEYKYIARTNSAAVHCAGENVIWTTGPNRTRSIPSPPAAPYTGKTIYYHSSWTNAFILYRVGTNFVSSPSMERLGQGRQAGEYLYKLSGIGVAGDVLEFVPYGYLNGTQYWDNAPHPGFGTAPAHNYGTRLDLFWLQDGHIFNYQPPATLSDPQVVETNVASSVTGIPGRNVRIYLPRGYDENEWKRYPVLYMHDGQNIFYPGGAFGTWRVDETATREISQGRARETIIVGIDNSANRLGEYCPPGDSVSGTPGVGDAYMDFVVHNVRPTIDTHYRTFNNPDNTLAAGSSMGGLISAYMGLEDNGVFGKVGVFSPSFWAASNFVSRIATNDTKGLRFYLDMGTDEGESMWLHGWHVYGLLLQDDYAQNADLNMVVGCGHGHNEAAWAARFPAAMRYLLPLTDEANLLTHEEVPLVVKDAAFVLSEGEWAMSYMAYHGWKYELQCIHDLLVTNWTTVATSGVQRLPWQPASLTDTGLSESAIYRLMAEPGP